MVGNQQQRKGRWTNEEDKKLRCLVAENSVDGEIDWALLEQSFNGTRDSKQIRERWVNHLNPTIKKRKFNDQEIGVIEHECSKHKYKWAKIAKKIPNATPLMIKNFYNNRLKKKNPANRRLSDSSATSFTTAYTINNFNNTTPTPTPTSTTTTTSTSTSTTNIINTTNLIDFNNNSNNNNDYPSTQEISYYNESNLSRNASNRSDRTVVALSRNSSIRTNNSSSTAVEPATTQASLSPSEITDYMMDPRNAATDQKLVFLAYVAGRNEKLPSQDKPKIMSISSICH